MASTITSEKTRLVMKKGYLYLILPVSSKNTSGEFFISNEKESRVNWV